jgi:membrane fusion protein (multidrug efflux system)
MRTRASQKLILGYMRSVILGLTGLAAVAVVGGGLYYYFSPQSTSVEATAQTRGAGSPPAGMGMSAGGARGGPPGMGRPSAVIVTKVATEVFDDHVEAIGTSSANESITVTAKVTGVIRSLNFDDGQYVEKGVEIAAINAGEQDGRLSAELANYDEQRKELQRITDLAKSNNVSQARIDQQTSAVRKADANLASARARVADYRIAAPFSGVLGTRKVSMGALVSPGTVITTLDDISTIKLDFAVPETFLATLRPGLDIEATTSAYQGEMFKGQVVSVDSRVDTVTRSVGIRALVPNKDARLKPGMLMVIDLIKDRRQSLMIPEEALIPENNNQYVFTIGPDNTANRVQIVMGRRRVGSVEVLEGLSEGDLVVTEGTMELRPGGKVQILNQDKIGVSPPSANVRGSAPSPPRGPS